MAINNSPVYLDEQPTATTRTTTFVNTSTNGTIAAGANSVAIANFGNAVGTVKDASLPVGGGVSWAANGRDTLDAISYNATGTTFLITTVV